MIPHTALHSFNEELLKIAKKENRLGKEELKTIEREVELWNKLRGSSPVEIKVDEDKSKEYGGGYFDQMAKTIGVSRNDYESLAHELGHAELDKKLWGRMLQHPVPVNAFEWTPIAGALGGVLVSKGKSVGLLLPALTAGPTLITEHLATRKGAKKLEEVGATKKEIEKFRKNLKDSYGTYLSIGPETAGGALAGMVVGSTLL